MSQAPALFVVAVLGWASLPDAAWAEKAGAAMPGINGILASLPTSNGGPDPRVLRDFYAARNNQPAWTAPRRAALAAEIQTVAQAEGMDALAYVPGAAETEIQADIALSATLARFGHDLAEGSVTPERSFGGFGVTARPVFDSLAFLRKLGDGASLADLASSAAPPFIGYARLRQALETVRAQIKAGGWPQIPEGPKLVPGDVDDRIPTLRRRLIASGELAAGLAEGRDYDAPLAEAVRTFQRSHGLEADGTVGLRTLANLNVPAEARLRQIMVNMERWRWMPRNPGRHHVLVNIPSQSLDVVEGGAAILGMRVVVGDVKHPTPSMVTTMSSVVLNPPWSVPPSIANKEILPKLRRDPNYLASSNLKITEYPEGSPEAAGDGVDWNAIGKKFPYRLRQPPGPDNALGQLKFNLVDSDDIYLHDTPNRRVFARTYRALSHGCVRLEHPVELGELMLGTHWQGRLAGDIAAKPSTRTLKLERKIPVYMVYFTVWTDEDGGIRYRDDIYGHDRRLAPALIRSRPPSKSGGTAESRL